MRFNLTQASYRIFERAARLRLQRGIAAISSAKLLWAIFDDDECRGAHWLADAGLSLEQFQAAFGIQTLQSPISAPSFPAGSYGISPGQYTPPPQYSSADIDAARTGNNSPPVGNPFPEPLPPDESEHEHQNEPHELQKDDWKPSEPPKYSLYSSRQSERQASGQSQLQFYLDEQRVSIGLLTPELEDNLEMVALRFVRQDHRQPISVSGGIKNIAIGTALLTLATEHLLLAVVLDTGDVGRWLQDNGFDPAELYQRIDGILEDRRQTIDDSQPQALTETFFDAPVDVTPATLPSISLPTAVSSQPSLYRILDAAANRGREAIRVIEDYVRFMRDRTDLTQRLKTFRHQFQNVLQQFPMQDRLEARNTEHDVGTEITAEGEYHRPSINDLVSVNFSRLQESLRSLEEFSKMSDANVAKRFEQLRYQCYTLHKDVFFEPDVLRESATVSSASYDKKDLLANACLYAIVNVCENETEFEQFISEIISGGVDVIQLRDKTADDRTLLERSRLLKQCIEKSDRQILFIMNDRPDLAVLAGADGVHVGQEEIPATLIRERFDSLLLGVSTHSMEQARQAVLEGADYIGAGPIFASATKAFSQFPGLAYLEAVSQEISIPVFAIGGITEERLDEVLQTGIYRIAVSSALLSADDPKETAQRYKTKINEVHPSVLE